MLRIVGAQFIGHADSAANLASAERMVREAAARGARIACLHELFNTMRLLQDPQGGEADSHSCCAGTSSSSRGC